MEQLTITGHVGQDAKIKDSNDGQFIVFSVAVPEKYTKANGEKVERTNWYNCTYWPKRTTIAEYLKKGTKVLIQGKPTYGTYQDKQNETQIDVGIRVNNVELLSNKPDATEQVEPATSQQLKPVATSSDDLPF